MQLSYYLMTSRAYIQQWPCAVARQWVAWYPDNEHLRRSVRQADGKSSGRDKHSLRSSTAPRPASVHLASYSEGNGAVFTEGKAAGICSYACTQPIDVHGFLTNHYRLIKKENEEKWRVHLSLSSRSSLCSLASISDYLWPPPACLPDVYSPYIWILFIVVPQSFTSSSSFLVPSIAAAAICLGKSWFCTLPKRPHHLSRRDFINYTVSGPCDMSFISFFVLIVIAFSFF